MLGAQPRHSLAVARVPGATPAEGSIVGLGTARAGTAAAAPRGWGAAPPRNKSFCVGDVGAALSCYEAGASLYFRAPVEASELLTTALSQQLGLSFGALHADGSRAGAHQAEVLGPKKDWTPNRRGDVTERIEKEVAGHEVGHDESAPDQFRLRRGAGMTVGDLLPFEVGDAIREKWMVSGGSSLDIEKQKHLKFLCSAVASRTWTKLLSGDAGF